MKTILQKNLANIVIAMFIAIFHIFLHHNKYTLTTGLISFIQSTVILSIVFRGIDFLKSPSTHECVRNHMRQK